MLNSFFAFLKSECERNTKLDLTGFINTLDLMNEEGIELPLTKILNNSKGVVLTTAHSSKGEEYDTVYIINANTDKWNKRPASSNFKLPQTLYSKQESFDEINDDRRLFFVAMTRAKTHLKISRQKSGRPNGLSNGLKRRQQKPGRFSRA
ncbi:MAG TPA: 3'-5' exonuclease [Cyclobacteriaceae bacterium]|nr:3'-5' exonuclease [Cyclobacteriaceae bacterium]